MAKNPWKKLLSHVRKSGDRSGRATRNTTKIIPVNITWHDLKEQFEKQDGKCYWFGTSLIPSDIFKTGYPLSMSVDRLDSKRGYDKDNIVITSRLANVGRGACDAATFKEIVHRILNNTFDT